MAARSLQMFKEPLNEGKEKVYNIRVMIVGQYGVGKTTLTQRLLGKNVNISERHSTDGIDVHVECSKVSLPAGKWTSQEKNAEKYSRLQRLVKFLNECATKQESKSKQVGQCELDGQVTSEEHDKLHPHHDLPVNADPDTNKEVKPPTSQPVDSPIARVVPEASSERVAKENKKDTVMEILQLVNENSGNIEESMVEYAALALWDFAGQFVFYTTHQTFLTSRAIYLLVIDLSQQITDFIKDDECFLDMEGIKLCKDNEVIEIWMNSIHSCTPSSQPGIPYVILVGTHVDKIPKNCRQRVIDEYFVHICEILSNKPAALHRMDCIAIDNTQDDPRLEELKKRIFELSKQQPHWGEEKPARWLPLEQAIMTLKASGVKVAPVSLIEDINRSGSVRIENSDELDLFLRYQHEMGTFLYFSIEGLSEKVVLDPQWLIDAQKSLITAGTFINKTPAIVSKWCEFKKSGKLTQELIDKFLPAPIFHRLLAACVAHWPVAKKNSENLIYCGCCVFHLDFHHRLTVFSRNHVIFVRVTIIGTTGKTQSYQFCTEVKEFITMTLSQIIGNLEQSLQFELHIQCPKSDGDNVNSLFRVADLQSNVDLPCHSHGDIHMILSSDLLRFWFQEQEPLDAASSASLLPVLVDSSAPATTDVPTQATTTISLPSTPAGLVQASTSISTSADVTQPPTVEDTDRFMHIACLLVNVGSRVLRRLLHFHTVTPVCTLDQYIANKRIDIDNLRKRRILNKSQMDILFPPGGSTNLGDYDITLLSALFTNIVLTISQQELNMIQFLRDKRNEIFAHAKSVTVNSNDYQTFWSDICSKLGALSK
ncbi:hypothetical protein CHS0354_020176 [Potamilus streckersoni]|uniref:Roc domain-containing protein n=1 Tax=Potamilus streckersoni TaxID=2493646 RepID=A0AAE0RM79_9BIVA|nr:hypothetical protein CHS0354_020176 [Potamilus streckersoni]